MHADESEEDEVGVPGATEDDVPSDNDPAHGADEDDASGDNDDASGDNPDHPGDSLVPIPVDVDEIVERFPEEEQEAIRMLFAMRSYSGPLPPADYFAGYDETVPGAAERILRMAEKNQDHRHAMENRQMDGEDFINERTFRSHTRAQYILLAIALALVFVAVYALREGESLTGLGLLATAIGGMVGGLFLARGVRWHGFGGRDAEDD